jgi:hypothetical protein
LGSQAYSTSSRGSKLEKEAAELEESVRREVTREIGGRYAERSQQASRVQGRLEEQIRALEAERAGRDQSWAAKLSALEETIPEAQEAARRETLATMEVELQASLEASERARSGLERRMRDQAEEFESERGQWMDRIEVLERKLEEARDLIFRRTGDPAARELDRFRHQLEEEYLALRDQWDEEKRQLRERIEALENVSSPE